MIESHKAITVNAHESKCAAVLSAFRFGFWRFIWISYENHKMDLRKFVVECENVIHLWMAVQHQHHNAEYWFNFKLRNRNEIELKCFLHHFLNDSSICEWWTEWLWWISLNSDQIHDFQNVCWWWWVIKRLSIANNVVRIQHPKCNYLFCEWMCFVSSLDSI